MSNVTCRNRAFTLVEVILSMAILTVFIGAALSLFLSTMSGNRLQSEYARALYLAQEGLEAARAIRDANYFLLTDGTYGLAAGPVYRFGAAPEIIDTIFERRIIVAPAYRDGTGALADIGTLDPEVKKVTSRITISALAGGVPRDVSLESYITLWSGQEVKHTLASDFSSLNRTNISVTSTAPPPTGNGALRLSTQFSADGFFSSADLGEHGNAVVTADQYAYVTTEKTQEGLSVVDFSVPSALRTVSNLNIGGKGNGIARTGNILGIGVEQSGGGFALVDISNRTAPQLLSRPNIGGIGNHVAFNGNLAYVTTDRTAAGLAIVDITNPASPALVRTVDLGGRGAAVSVYQDFLLVGVSSSRGASVYRLTDPRAPIFVNRYSMDGGYATGFVVDFPYVYVSAANDGDELFVARMSDQGILTHIVDMNLHSGNSNSLAKSGSTLVFGGDDVGRGIVQVDITNPLSPRVIENKDIDAKALGLALIPPYIGVATDTNNKGFVLVGGGNQGFAGSGQYTSQALDSGSIDPVYFSVRFDGTFPPGTTTSVELRSAATVSGLASASWSPSYSISPSIVNTPRLRYFQYRVNFTGTPQSTPTLETLTVLYER